MIKFCVEQWDKNKDVLREYLKSRTDLNSCSYLDLVKAVVEHIFNRNADLLCYDEYNADKITEIDNGDYQGTLIFLIPRNTYQPDESEYLMTYVGYGSCSVCDTLQRIQEWDDGPLSTSQLDDFMRLCKHLVQNTIKPYNHGWRYGEKYDAVEDAE